MLGRLRGRSAAELIGRAQQASVVWLERLVGFRPPPPRALARRASARSGLLPTPERVSRVVEALRAEPLGADWCGLSARAEAAMRGRLSLLGYPERDVGMPPRWHQESQTGQIAPRLHWSRVPYLDPAVVGDHKVVWELNRHQHFLWLAIAHRVTDDVRYLQALELQWSSWLDENPPGIGINWSSSLEVGFRAIAWIWTERVLAGSAGLSRTLDARILASLWQHGVHLSRHLSTWFSPNTHLTGEALALAYLDAHLDSAATAAWGSDARALLGRVAAEHLSDDGVYFESSLWYQRYTIDIFSHAAALMRGAGERVPGALEARVAAAAELLQQVMRPDGTLPLIGDDDGGCLLSLDARSVLDAGPTMAVASVVLDRPDICPPGSADLRRWLTDAPPSLRTPTALVGRVARHGGLAVLRTGWTDDATVLTLDAAPHGALSGGHGHADALGVDVVYRGLSLVVDAGTGRYVGAEREHLRREEAHSLVSLPAHRMAITRGAFGWERRADGTVDAAGRLGCGAQWVSAAHEGCAGLHDARVERFALLASDGDLLIADRVWLSGGAGVDARIRWLLHPAVHPRVQGRCARIAWAAGAAVLIEGSTPIGAERARSSDRYGVIDQTSSLVADWVSGAGQLYVTTIGSGSRTVRSTEQGSTAEIVWGDFLVRWSHDPVARRASVACESRDDEADDTKARHPRTAESLKSSEA